MICTKDEAGAKCCPVRLAVVCCADECMAWRPMVDGRGYCGMAGTPVEVNTQSAMMALNSVRESFCS